LRGKTGQEIHDRYVKLVMNLLFHFIQFIDGLEICRKFDVSDDPHSGQLVEVTNKFHVEKVWDLLDED
jgi:hypothetical protein